MKTINFNEDGSMRNDLQTAFFNTGLQVDTILKGIEPSWNRIDSEVDAVSDADAVDELNHDCKHGPEDACDCDAR